MNEYPVITVPKGQFVVIDGFLVKLGIDDKEQNEVFLRDARNLLTFAGWSILRNSFYPNTLLKMQEMRSNYYLTRHRSFFQLMKSKTYVVFMKKQGRYCCRRVDHSRATHVALSVKLGPRSQRLKYVVFDKPLTRSEHQTDDLYDQQNQDLQEVQDALTKNAPPKGSVDRENAIMQNILFVTEEELHTLRGCPITSAKLERIKWENDRPRIETLLELKKSLLNICLESSFWQLKRLNDRCNHTGLQDVFDNCKKQINQTLPIISEQNFPHLIQQWLDERTPVERISDRYIVTERFVVDLESQLLVDPQSKESLASLNMIEREKIAKADLLDWNVLKLCKGTYAVHGRKLFDLAKCTEVTLFEDSNGQIQTSRPEEESSNNYFGFTCRCILVDFKDFGSKVLYEKIEILDVPKENGTLGGNMPPKFVIPRDIDDKKYDYLFKNLDYFVSSKGLKTLYVKTFEQFKSRFKDAAMNKTSKIAGQQIAPNRTRVQHFET